MRPMLAVSEAIDKLNEKIGYICNLMVLASCLVSAGNAMIRYAFGYSSNGWLELQWYMFAILVMCALPTLAGSSRNALRTDRRVSQDQDSPSISTNFQLTAAPRAGLVRRLHASSAG